MNRGREIRTGYWKYAEEKIRSSLPELYQKASLFTDRSAFDSICKNNMLITCIANRSPKVLSVGIYFRKPNNPDWNKERAEQILREKEHIRKKLTFSNVRIAPADTRRRGVQRNDYNVLFTIDIDVLDQANWDMCCKFHCNTAKEIYDNIFLKFLALDQYASTNSISEKESLPDSNMDFFALRAKAIAEGAEKPEKEEIIEHRYKRSDIVVRYALRRANGICQLCEKPAPFCDNQGIPFLEVHHVKWLSEGGADSIYNTVALCPNCHRKIHKLNNISDISKLKRSAENDLIFI